MVIEALEKIEAAAQGNARLAAIKEMDAACPGVLRTILKYALSPDITFGVKKLPEYCFKNDGWNDQKWYESLLSLLEALKTRKLTGNAAQEELASFLSCCNDKQAKWTERIIKQDLRINIGAKDVNKAIGEIVIYLFEVPLATDYAKVKEKDLKGKWALQPKLDGGRAVAILPGDGGPVRMLSRTGKEWGNFETIRKELNRTNSTRSEGGPTVYLDGEVVSLDSEGRIDFQMIQKTMMRKDGVEVGNLQFIVFDAATEADWFAEQRDYKERLDYARQLVELINSPVIKLIPTLPTVDVSVKTLEGQCLEFVEDGYEGCMARRFDLPVENKRSKRLLKVKTFLDDEATVLSCIEGVGKYEGMLGAIRCKHKNGKEFEIGSGLDDKQRTEFWAQRGNLPKLVSFKYFELTDDGIPRFPIFRYFRFEDDI